MGIEWTPGNTFSNDPHHLCERLELSATSYGNQQVLARMLSVLDRIAARCGGDQTQAMRNAVEMLEDLTPTEDEQVTAVATAVDDFGQWGDDYPRW